MLARTAGPVAMSSGIELVARRSLHTTVAIDTLIVCGGIGTDAALADRELLAWLRRQQPRVQRLASVCTGALLLAEAGLLDGRRATTHWSWCDRLARDYPRVDVVPDAIYVRDGGIYTSAGVTAGIDLALAMVEEDWGREVALGVARELVVFLKRPGGQSQFSRHLATLQPAPRPIRELELWALDNLAADLSVEALADRVHMSPAQLRARLPARDRHHAGEVRRGGPRRGSPPAARRDAAHHGGDRDRLRLRHHRVDAPGLPAAPRHRAGRVPAPLPAFVAGAAASDRRAHDDPRRVAAVRRRSRAGGCGPRQLIRPHLRPRRKHMKPAPIRSVTTLLAIASMVVVVAMVAPPRAARAAAEEAPLALGGNDPVRLAGGQTVVGSVDLELAHAGLRYRFSTQATRDQFAAEPARYAIQNDSCPVVAGAPADPSIFAVHEGRIYTFATEECRENFLAEPARYVGAKESPNPESAATRRTVAILVYDGVELLDFAGPGEVFAAAGRFDVFTVGPTMSAVTSQGFVEVQPRYSVASAPRPDILIVPGGAAGNVISNAAVMSWIKSTAARAEQVLSVCNGAMVLAHAGLLDGLEATTHHGSIAALRQHAPRTKVHDDRRFVDNGKVVTAAGVSAGIDMSLHVVSKLLGAGAAASPPRATWSTPGPSSEAARLVRRCGQSGSRRRELGFQALEVAIDLTLRQRRHADELDADQEAGGVLGGGIDVVDATSQLDRLVERQHELEYRAHARAVLHFRAHAAAAQRPHVERRLPTQQQRRCQVAQLVARLKIDVEVLGLALLEPVEQQARRFRQRPLELEPGAIDRRRFAVLVLEGAR